LADYYLISFGGAGPLFMAGYTEGLNCKGVFTVPWAPAFSAFGCTTADYVHRYQRSCLLTLPPHIAAAAKVAVGKALNRIWRDLEIIAVREMAEEGFQKEAINFEQIAYIRYGGQLEDLEVVSPASRIRSAADMDRLLAAYEEKYSRVYAYGARHAEAGFQMYEVGLRASVPKPKPRLTKFPLQGQTPPAGARKGTRPVYVDGKWHKAALYEMDRLEPGNEVAGLAIIEAPATTLPVPQGKKIVIDEYKRFWLRER
jgi:N-methylhydantoinase A